MEPGHEINWFKNNSQRQFRQRLIPSQRVELLHEYIVHKLDLKEISEKYDIEKATIYKVAKGYTLSGRIFKLLPTHSK